MTIGAFGNVLVVLALVSGGIAAIGLLSAFLGARGAAAWQRMGKISFTVHSLSVVGVIVTLLAMIFTHRYEYHYVWSHSSNELPTHFMLSCLWEGQEGSFLIWMFWHAVLGTAILYFGARKWRSGAVGVIASVQFILATMVLGIHLPEPLVRSLMLLLVLLPASLLLWYALRKTNDDSFWPARFSATHKGIVGLGAGVLALWFAVNILLGQTGYAAANVKAFIYNLEYILLLLAAAGLAYLLFTRGTTQKLLFTLVPLLGLGFVLAFVPLEGWNIGSSPFVYLRDAFPNDPVYTENPDFVPTNGTGLNPLLQNYWMVIHPPTLFLGFAATLIPFAYVVSALLKRDYTSWVPVAKPWALFSAMILGVGIIMGGYWAYETLNFGGYWNWDPVENASFVPWLISVGAVHTLLAYRSGKTNLRTSMLLLVATFVFVLYSTFLTRSGILGDTSVHSFTDLGLSGQLLVLLFVYFGAITLLMADRWKELPASRKQSKLWTKETMLFSSALVLVVAAAEISLVTSMPVFNKIFGLNLAPPAETGYFFYKWNVWFGAGIALLSGMGQYFFWLRVEGRSRSRALFRPFLFALLAAMTVMALITWSDWEFAFQEKYNQSIAAANQAGGLAMVFGYLGTALLMIADEILLAAGLFTLFANLDIMLRLVLKHSSHLRRMGGSLAHIGFGMMLLGILFSSGYEDIVSVNLTPDDLPEEFSEEMKADNVQLILNEPKYIKGYKVTYLGKNYPEPPFRNFDIILREQGLLKIGFKDQSGERYAVILPERPFLIRETANAQEDDFPGTTVSLGEGGAEPTDNAQVDRYPVDEQRVQQYISSEYEYLQPELMNDRTIYRIEFESLENPDKSFTVEPETEMAGDENITPHPDRKIKFSEDVYVHISGVPSEEGYQLVREEAKVGLYGRDTLAIGSGMKLVVDSLVQVYDIPEYRHYEMVIRAKVRVLLNDETYKTNPTTIIDKNQLIPMPSEIEPLGVQVAFVGVVTSEGPDQGKVVLNVGRRSDFVTFQAIRKPYINLLWVGTFILTAGFLMAIIRRVGENQRREKKQNRAA